MTSLLDDIKNMSIRIVDGDDYISMNSKYVPLKLDATNVHSIPSLSDIKKSILFVDGGSSVLFEGAGFAIGFIRVAGIIYSNNKRITRHLEEFYTFISEIDGKYVARVYFEYEKELSCIDLHSFSFNPEDELLKNGIEKCDASRIISVIRRFAEIQLSDYYSKDVDFVIMDGTLESRYPGEDLLLKKSFKSGKICSLSKTCSLTTKKGVGITRKILAIIKSIETKDTTTWYYYPVIQNNNPTHLAEMYFIKLNKNSDYVFRFEVQKDFLGDILVLLYLLSINSNDPIFLGYPYGLIDVDQYARVSEEESSIFRTRLSVKLGKDWNELSKHVNSMNAHSILDKIRF